MAAIVVVAVRRLVDLMVIGLLRLSAGRKTLMNTSHSAPSQEPLALMKVNRIRVADVISALKAGGRDFMRRPALSLFFGLVFVIFGYLFLGGLFVFDQIWIFVPAGIGFPLVAPFVAVGLYEMSRRFSRNEPFKWSDIFLVIFRQQRREFGWMSFVVLFVFWVWLYQVRLLLALFLQWQSFSTLTEFWLIIVSTQSGALFILVGTMVGAVLATVLFSLTVISMPLLLDREIDFVSAMILSVKSVIANPVVMLGWGAAIGAMVFVAMIPALLGLLIILPILGHTTWHLYTRTISHAQ